MGVLTFAISSRAGYDPDVILQTDLAVFAVDIQVCIVMCAQSKFEDEKWVNIMRV